MARWADVPIEDIKKDIIMRWADISADDVEKDIGPGWIDVPISDISKEFIKPVLTEEPKEGASGAPLSDPCVQFSGAVLAHLGIVSTWRSLACGLSGDGHVVGTIIKPSSTKAGPHEQEEEQGLPLGDREFWIGPNLQSLLTAYAWERDNFGEDDEEVLRLGREFSIVRKRYLRLLRRWARRTGRLGLLS